MKPPTLVNAPQCCARRTCKVTTISLKAVLLRWQTHEPNACCISQSAKLKQIKVLRYTRNTITGRNAFQCRSCYLGCGKGLNADPVHLTHTAFAISSSWTHRNAAVAVGASGLGLMRIHESGRAMLDRAGVAILCGAVNGKLEWKTTPV